MSNGLAKFDLQLPASRFRANILPNNRSNAEMFKIVTEKHALINSDLSESDLFFFPIVASNYRLDSYFTRMAESSLKNYAADANEGVSFLNSHNSRELPLGRSMTGTYDTTGIAGETYVDGDLPRVLADIYTVRNLKLNGVNTNDFIRGIEVGIVKDVSIGFKEGEGFQYTCSVCGMDLWDWDCEHIPGATYNVCNNPDMPANQRVYAPELCFALIENAQLSEVSAVADGATPNAMIQKATRETRAGRLRSDVAHELQIRYRFSPETRLWTKGADSDKFREQKQENDNMPTELEKQLETQLTNVRAEMESAQTTATLTLNTLRANAAKLGITEIEKITTFDELGRSLIGEIERLQPLATAGESYRSELIQQTVVGKIRAFGDAVEPETLKTQLERNDIETLKQLRNSYQELGDVKFGNGRSSTDEAEAPAEKDEKQPNETARQFNPIVPSSAFSNV